MEAQAPEYEKEPEWVEEWSQHPITVLWVYPEDRKAGHYENSHDATKDIEQILMRHAIENETLGTVNLYIHGRWYTWGWTAKDRLEGLGPEFWEAVTKRLDYLLDFHDSFIRDEKLDTAV